MTDDLNIFSKMDSPIDELQEKSIGANKYIESKRKIRDICVAIALPSEEYNPKTIVDLMNEYINDKQFLNRILYSEVSSFIYGLEDLSLEIFLSNIDTLQSYVSDTQNSIDIKTQNTIIKLCDHATLAKQQKELISTKKISQIIDVQKEVLSIQREMLYKYQEMDSEFKGHQKTYADIDKNLNEYEYKFQMIDNDLKKLNDLNLELQQSVSSTQKDYADLKGELAETAEEYNNNVKNTQREYISIFGVFSAIIITFVGGLSFTTSVMNGINLASRYRIVFIVSLIGFVVINLIHYLLEFLTHMSKYSQKSNIIQEDNRTVRLSKIRIFFSKFRLKKNNLRNINIILVGILIIDTILFFLDEGSEYFERIIDSIKNIINMF